MSFTVGRGLNSCARSLISDRIFSLTTISCLRSVNHDVRNKKNNQILCQKILQPVLVQQHRYFSINFHESLFESVVSSEPTKVVADVLIRAHELSGVHWWGTLVAAPFVLKLFYSIPCAVYQHKLIAKTELITQQAKPLIVDLKHEIMIEGRQKKWSGDMMQKHFKRQTRKLMKKIMIDNNIHPFKLVILSLIQIPPWMLMTMSISKLGKDVSSGSLDSVPTLLQYPVGGPSWCSDLSSPDPTYVLPATLFLFSWVGAEVNWLMKPQKDGFSLKLLNNLYRLFSFVFFLVAVKVSAGLSLFWAANAVFNFGQNLLLFSPRVRRFLRIPKTPSELEKPYSNLVQQVRNKFSKLSKK